MIRTNFYNEASDMFNTGVIPDDTLKFSDFSQSIVPDDDTGRNMTELGKDPFKVNDPKNGNTSGIAGKDSSFSGIAEGMSYIESMLDGPEPSSIFESEFDDTSSSLGTFSD